MEEPKKSWAAAFQAPTWRTYIISNWIELNHNSQLCISGSSWPLCKVTPPTAQQDKLRFCFRSKKAAQSCFVSLPTWQSLRVTTRRANKRSKAQTFFFSYGVFFSEFCKTQVDEKIILFVLYVFPASTVCFLLINVFFFFKNLLQVSASPQAKNVFTALATAPLGGGRWRSPPRGRDKWHRSGKSITPSQTQSPFLLFWGHIMLTW